MKFVWIFLLIAVAFYLLLRRGGFIEAPPFTPSWGLVIALLILAWAANAEFPRFLKNTVALLGPQHFP